jgi:ATP-dependent RNA helicase
MSWAEPPSFGPSRACKPLGEDIHQLEYGQHIVSGTPGHIFNTIRHQPLPHTRPPPARGRRNMTPLCDTAQPWHHHDAIAARCGVTRLQRRLHTRNIKMLILDKADQPLNKGLEDQIYNIYHYLPSLPPCGSASHCTAYDLRRGRKGGLEALYDTSITQAVIFCNTRRKARSSRH